MAARAEKAASSCCWGAGPSAWPGLTGRFPSPSPGISVSLCPWASRGALRPVTGQPHPQPLAPGLFARSSGQRAAVAKRCPPPQYHLHLEGCHALTCVRPFSLLEVSSSSCFTSAPNRFSRCPPSSNHPTPPASGSSDCPNGGLGGVLMNVYSGHLAISFKAGLFPQCHVGKATYLFLKAMPLKGLTLACRGPGAPCTEDHFESHFLGVWTLQGASFRDRPPPQLVVEGSSAADAFGAFSLSHRWQEVHGVHGGAW